MVCYISVIIYGINCNSNSYLIVYHTTECHITLQWINCNGVPYYIKWINRNSNDYLIVHYTSEWHYTQGLYKWGQLWFELRGRQQSFSCGCVTVKCFQTSSQTGDYIHLHKNVSTMNHITKNWVMIMSK